VVEYVHKSVAAGSNFKRAVALALVVVVVASGCSLGTGKAGAKCPKVGNYASDGVYVLKCNARKRWERGITVAAGQALLNAAIAANKPKPTSPPTSPPVTAAALRPPITAFGVIDVEVGTSPGQVKPGLYTTSGDDCSWARYDAGDNIIGSNLFNGRDFVLIRSSDVYFASFGPCYWVEAPGSPQSVPASGDATRRVGIEIQPGLYRSAGTTSGSKCTWFRESSNDGSVDAIIDAASTHGPQIVEVKASDAAFETRSCPPFVQLSSIPARVGAISGAPDEYITGGQRATFAVPFDAVTASGTAVTGITAQFGPYQLQLNPPTGGAFTVGASVDAVWTATSALSGMRLTSNGRSCSSNIASFDIEQLSFDSGGNLSAIDVTFAQICDGSGKIVVGAVKY